MSTLTPTAPYAEDAQITHAEGQLSAASRAFQEAHAKLYRSDGSPKYSQQEHDQRYAALTAALDNAHGSIHATADELEQANQTIVEYYESGDPLDELTLAEQTAASAKALFVAKDAERLRPEELRSRLRVALAGTDRASQYLWARYVGERIEAAASPDRDVSDKAGIPTAIRQELATLVTSLEEKIRGPQAAVKKEKAEATLKRLRELRRTARTAYDDATKSQERQFEAARAQYAGRF